VNKAVGPTIEEIASTMSAAAERATKGLREVSDAVAELREAEMILKGLAASQTIAIEEHRKPRNDENPRLAYRPDEAAKLLGVSRKTIQRRINNGTLVSTKVLGGRLISAESVKALFEPSE
jgi:excisionase family DNA binding protein